ncbi:MAG: prepilin-type cleavage/methylation domain-containing protein [Burkholderiales bacterium PBB1]|nr:MAG: prepilin-type cleavage/methylation domain-containing protein [Burkholderiales bacterium PBB1]
MKTPRASSGTRRGLSHQAGLTLVELLVAVTLGLLVTLAAVAALLIGRQGFTSVDQSSQLRENARFAASLIQRIVIQAGYESHRDGTVASAWRYFCSGSGQPCGDINGDRNPGIVGYDNALVGSLTLPTGLVSGNRTSGCGAVTDTSCLNGDDILVVRYWGDSRAGAAVGDGSMINCSGANELDGTVPAYSIFHVARSASGEPTLACTYRDVTGTWQTVPLMQGVEGFQVLYGVDNVTPATAPPSGETGLDGVPDRYLRASQLTVSGNTNATMDNWRRVRSVRIGLLLRGDPGSAVDRAASARSYEVLGPGLAVSGDVGSSLAVPADGRLRQPMVFTVHLRNRQYVTPPTWNP